MVKFSLIPNFFKNLICGLGVLFVLFGAGGNIEVKAATTPAVEFITVNSGDKSGTIAVYNDGSKKTFLGLAECRTDSNKATLVSTLAAGYAYAGIGAGTGATVGAGAGAVGGTFIFPVVGTALGAGSGAGAGAAVGTAAGFVTGVAGELLTAQKVTDVTNTCAGAGGYSLKGVGYGDEYKGQTEILSGMKGDFDQVAGGSIAQDKEGNSYLQIPNGNYKFYKKGELEANCGGNLSGCAYIDQERRLLLAVTPVSQILLQAATNQNPIIAGNAIGQKMSTNGAICRTNLDKDGKPVFYCIKSGKATGPGGDDSLIEKCKSNAVGDRIYFSTADDGKTIACIEKEVATAIQNAAVNKAIVASSTAEIKNQNTPEGIAAAGLGAIINIILLIVSVFVLIIAYIAGWLLITGIWMLGYLFIIVLRINPAGADFVNVAADPWRIVVGVANMLVLSTFIFVGFGYILDIAKLKVKLEQFFLNIIVFTVVLNFTLLGSASIVNVTQGLGEIMIGAYAVSESDPKRANFALINGLVDGIARASVIRCGNIEFFAPKETSAPTPSTTAVTALQTGASQIANTDTKCSYGFDGLAGQVGKVVGSIGSAAPSAAVASAVLGRELKINGRSGSLITITAMEIAFCVIAWMAITAFWQATMLAIMRTIGLWILIVLSPLALAAYISPIQGLKQYATKWVDYFWKWVMFYPAFIFGLILVNIMARSFGSAANAGIQNLKASNSGVNVFADVGEIAGGQDGLTILMGAFLSIVVILTFKGMVTWFEKQFAELAKMAMGAVKQGWNLLKTGAGVVGGGIAAAGGSLDKLGSKRINDKISKNLKNKDGEINKVNEDIKNKLNGRDPSKLKTKEKRDLGRLILQRRKLEGERKQIEKDGEEERKKGGKLNLAGKFLQKGGNMFAAAPDFAEFAFDEAKYNLWGKRGNSIEAKRKANKKAIQLKYELYLRSKANTQEEKDAIDVRHKEFLGQGSEQINSMKEENPEHYSRIIASAVRQEELNALGIDDKTKIKDQEAAENDLKKMISKYGSDYERLVKDGRLQDLLRYIKMSKNNAIIRNILLNDPLGIKLTQSAMPELAQTPDGPETANWLKEDQPATIADPQTRRQAGREIANKFNANPTSYKFPDGINDPDVMAGIKDNMNPQEYYKRFGNKPFTPDTLSSAGREIQIKARSNSAYSGLKLENKDEEKAFENVRNTVFQGGYRGNIAKAMSDPENIRLGLNAEAIVQKVHEEEFGTRYRGENEGSLDAGVAEIMSKDLATLERDSKAAARITSKNAEVKRLKNGTPEERAKAEKLVKLGVIEAFYATSKVQDTLYEGAKELGNNFKTGKAWGNDAAAPYTYASDQIDKLNEAANGDPEKLKQLIASEEARNAFGAARIADIVTAAKNKGDAMTRRVGIEQRVFVGKEPGAAATLQRDMLLAIAKSARSGINIAGQFNDTSFISNFNTAAITAGHTGIDIINADELAQSIANSGQEWVNQIKIEAEVNPGTVMRSIQEKLDSAGESVVGGYMGDVNKQDDKFVSGSDIRPTTVVAGNTVTYVAPPPPPIDPMIQYHADLATWHNNIAPFRRLTVGGKNIAIETRPQAGIEYGALIDQNNGDWVDDMGNVVTTPFYPQGIPPTPPRGGNTPPPQSPNPNTAQSAAQQPITVSATPVP